MSHVNVDVDKMKTENESPCINSATEQPLPGATRSQFPYKVRLGNQEDNVNEATPKLPAKSTLIILS